jgi:uncharacterized protein
VRTAPGVEAYGGGGFRIAGQRYEGSVLILDDAVRPWPAADLKSVTPESLALVFAVGLQAVEFVLIGTGAALAPAPRAVRDAVQAAGLGLEVMSTPEACRLYNLMAEDGRRVACALIAI